MRLNPLVVATVLLVVLPRAVAAADTQNPANTRALDKIVAAAVRQVQAGYPSGKLKDEDVAVTVTDLRTPAAPRVGSWNGEAPIYPASVVKLFYLVAAHGWMED